MKIYSAISEISSSWIKSIDVLNLFLIILLALLGLLFVTTASPSIAKLKQLEEFYFVKKHGFFMILSIILLIFYSIFTKKIILKSSFLGAGICYVFMIISLFQNSINNGASRWVNIMGYSMQPSELLKPFLIVILAFLISSRNKIKIKNYELDGKVLAFFLLTLTSLILIKQPNYSMVTILFFVLLSQLFIAGISLKLTFTIIFTIITFSIFSYFSLAHVKKRVLDYAFSEKPNYQVEKSIQAFSSGGLLGNGPGDGKIKKYIPDAHTDFIFPVIAEEYGVIVCISIIFIIFIIFFRGLHRASKIKDLFSLLTCSGLLVLFIAQALTNISVSLKLIPTTGVTLPLISYGGSSLLSMGIVMGIMLALTRKEFGPKY
ncbi:MAG: cell division protein FtsW [Alphaproteobacteria bacterium TMED93]|nr:MAG: cell division protein FtsW [Alphaproteobacteria bacterium TMED93]